MSSPRLPLTTGLTTPGSALGKHCLIDASSYQPRKVPINQTK
jgi:hypothetical protein